MGYNAGVEFGRTGIEKPVQVEMKPDYSYCEGFPDGYNDGFEAGIASLTDTVCEPIVIDYDIYPGLMPDYMKEVSCQT